MAISKETTKPRDLPKVKSKQTEIERVMQTGCVTEIKTEKY